MTDCTGRSKVSDFRCRSNLATHNGSCEGRKPYKPDASPPGQTGPADRPCRRPISPPRFAQSDPTTDWVRRFPARNTRISPCCSHMRGRIRFYCRFPPSGILNPLQHPKLNRHRGAGTVNGEDRALGPIRAAQCCRSLSMDISRYKTGPKHRIGAQ